MSRLLRVGSFGWLLLVLFPGIAGVIQAATVELVGHATLEATSTRAVVRWRTDKDAGTLVLYGPSVEPPIRKFKGRVGIHHEAELTGLEPSTCYRVILCTARDPLQTNEFVTPPAGTSLLAAIPLIVIVPPPRAAAAMAVETNGPTASLAGISEELSGKTNSTAAPVAVQPSAAPHSRETWGDPKALNDHFRRHGADFHARDPEDYAAQAWHFRRRAASSGFRVKKDSKGVLRVFDSNSRTFGAYNANGTTRTFFKASRVDYFDKQPGKEIQLHE